MPEELSENLMREIKDNVSPYMSSTSWEDTAQYNCGEILQMYWNLQDVIQACDGCEYIEM